MAFIAASMVTSMLDWFVLPEPSTVPRRLSVTLAGTIVILLVWKFVERSRASVAASEQD